MSARQKNTPKGGENFKISSPGSPTMGGKGSIGKVIGPKSATTKISGPKISNPGYTGPLRAGYNNKNS